MKANVPLAMFLALLVWVPIPLGSNRPIFWLINAVLVIAILALLLVRNRHPLPISGTRILALMSIAALCIIAWMVFQAAGWTPAAWHHPAWDRIEAGGALSINPSGSYYAAIQFLGVAMAAIIALRLSLSRARARIILWTVVVSASVVGGWGLIAQSTGMAQQLFGDGDPASRVLTSFFGNRNSAATYLGIGLVVALSLLLVRVQRSEFRGLRALVELPVQAGPLGMIVLLLGVALLATGSRAGIAAGLIGAVVTVVVSLRRPSLIPVSIVGVVVLAIAGAVLFLGESAELFFTRIGDLEITGEVRWDVYRDVIDAIAERPLLGHGAGTFAEFFPLFHSADVPSTGVWLEAHNTYLEVAAELGLPVFLLGLAGLIVVVTRCFRAGRRSLDPAAIAAVGAAAVVGVHSMFDFSLQIQAVGIAFGAILGAGLAASVAERSERSVGVDEERTSREYETYGVLPEAPP